MQVTRRAAAVVLAVAVVALAASIFIGGWEGRPGASADAPRCPKDYFPRVRQAGPSPDGALASARADSTAVVLCSFAEDPGRVQREPLASAIEHDAVARLVRAVEALPAQFTIPQGCRRVEGAVRVLVFLHPDGPQMYTVRTTKRCSRMSDGLEGSPVPPDVAAFIASA